MARRSRGRGRRRVLWTCWRGAGCAVAMATAQSWRQRRSVEVGNEGWGARRDLVGEGEAERATVESGGEDRGVRSLIPSSGVASEVVGRRRARTVPPDRRNRQRPGMRNWAWPAGPVSVALGPGAGGFPFSIFFSSFCIFLLATNDFAKLCHWLKQFQRIILHCHKKIVRLCEKGSNFYKLKSHLIYCFSHYFNWFRPFKHLAKMLVHHQY